MRSLLSESFVHRGGVGANVHDIFHGSTVNSAINRITYSDPGQIKQSRQLMLYPYIQRIHFQNGTNWLTQC
jgi:hypothetical protein